MLRQTPTYADAGVPHRLCPALCFADARVGRVNPNEGSDNVGYLRYSGGRWSRVR